MTSKMVATKNQISGFRKEISKAKKIGNNSFYTWFNHASNMESSFIRGQWDFSVHVASKVFNLISNPEDKMVLEIGYGGGRLIAAASQHFKKAIGIDVHNQRLMVEKQLKKMGVHNVELIKTTGKGIPLNDNSMSLVYSFIVLQHVAKIEIFKSYLKETYRILKDGGIAILYIGRYTLFSYDNNSNAAMAIDQLLENFLMPRGFKEMPSKINDINLLITLDYAQELALKEGFHFIGHTTSLRNIPNEKIVHGKQYGIILKKPNQT